MVPIGGKPLLEHLLELVKRHGITDVLINSHHLAHVVEEFVQRKDHGINIRLSYEPSLLGSAGTVAANRDFVDGQENFFIIYADCLTDIDLSEMLDFHRGHNGILTVGVYESPHPELGGVVTLDSDNRVVEFAEKAPEPQGKSGQRGYIRVQLRAFRLYPRIVSLRFELRCPSQGSGRNGKGVGSKPRSGQDVRLQDKGLHNRYRDP